MHIVTPKEITSVVWEGELIPSETTRAVGSGDYPIVTIGQPEVWPVAYASESQMGQKWITPLGDARYWLVRLACTLRDPGGMKHITEAQQTLSLRPRSLRAGKDSTYAFSLFPERLDVEHGSEFTISLGPSLKLGEVSELKVGQVGAKIDFRKVFPVIRSYGLGEQVAYWIYQRHARYPLDGSQFAYAVLASGTKANGILAAIDMTVTVETSLGPLRLGLSREARDIMNFAIS